MSIRFGFVLAPLLAASVANAATSINSARVVDVVPDVDYGVVYVKFDADQAGSTSCVQDKYKSQYQISNLGTPIGDALLSTALTALAMNNEVRAVGRGVCDGREGMETLRLISFQPQ
ncbi:hypothetical protein [Marinimicrobium locisalis]|uniref:hypothetical protein n=1 Tax=Marinimicrobium locisalis TaxID=546022 RepID=UPI003222231A